MWLFDFLGIEATEPGHEELEKGRVVQIRTGRGKEPRKKRVFKLKITDSVKVNPYGIYELINDT